MAGKAAAPQSLGAGDRATLLRMTQTAGSPAAQLRARIVLLAADGMPNVKIAELLGVSRPTVNLWRGRFAQHGAAGLTADRPSRERAVDARQITVATLRSCPDQLGTTPWSSRSLASTLGISHVTVTRAWREFGLRPAGPDTFTFDTQPALTATVTDMLGIFISPVECALMLRVQRTGAGPPSGQGTSSEPPPLDLAASHATGLRATLQIAAENVARWRTPAFETRTLLNFFEDLGRHHPGGAPILVLDNSGTIERPEVGNWLSAHPHVDVVTTANLAAWLNLVDVWLTQIAVRTDAGTAAVLDLMERIRPLATSKAGEQPFVWTKPPERDTVRHAPSEWGAGTPVQGSLRRPTSSAVPGPRGFPFVAQAGHTKFGPDRVTSYGRVQSRAVVGCHAGRGRLTLNGTDHPLRPGLLYVLPWDHSIVYRPDPRDPFFVFGVHVIPWQLADQPLRFSAAHDEHDQFFGVDWRKPYAPGEPEPTQEVVVTTEAERPGLAALTRLAVERFLRGLPSPTEGRALGVLAMTELNAPSSIRPEDDPLLPAGLRGLLVWITRDLSRTITLSDMAAVLECSPSTVTRQFRHFLDCAPMDWVIGQRIELAQQLLAAGNPTIAAVARSCGYDDPEYFSRLFKYRVGSSPREWRHFRTI